MERAGDDKFQIEAIDPSGDSIDSRTAVNSLILDYYKKFGRKRDLEQFFSLSTAQSDIRDTTGLFWRKMKSENDSSESGGQKSDSSHELCRISIRCSVPTESSSQDDDPKTKSESPQTVSPPIIIEEVHDDDTRHTDEEFNKSDDNNSQKSLDALLDLSTHKPLSPTSSITSQRKLEWDSLADVGYGNESDRKTSASSLSTLERLALKQQYSNNDSKQDIGLPTSQSTPLDEKDSKSKVKKGVGKKTKIYQRDVDVVEVNVPNMLNTHPPQSINVNLTKHISFNVEKDGGITIDTVKRDVNVSPEKLVDEKAVAPYLGMDKEIQTTLDKSKEVRTSQVPKLNPPDSQKVPVMISLNVLKKRLRKKRRRVVRKRIRSKNKIDVEVPPQEKSGEHLSAAESFEYMPGHIYNQNQMNVNDPKPDNSNGNKSSLESSGALTTDSSKGSRHSITKDLEKCMDLLKVTLQQRYDDGDLKKKLIKDIVQRLLKSKYRDDDSTTDFLSGLSYNSKKLDLGRNNTTSSTSDANNTDNSNQKRPKKSILRLDKFNPNIVASTSQSAPNLLTAASNENDDRISTNLTKHINSNTESDSSRGKSSSDNNELPKTSSEELYLKYLEALRREEAYKRHLKEMFLKQKLVKSDAAFKVPVQQNPKINRRLKDLMNDLTRNNYDDGSGDASKLEGSVEFDRQTRNQRSQSVFTLSSCHSEAKRPNLKKSQSDKDLDEPGSSRDHYCCCPHHFVPCPKVSYVDSSVQVNMRCIEEQTSNKKSEQDKVSKACPRCNNSHKITSRVISDNSGEVKYICVCNTKAVASSDTSDNIKIYKCSRLTNRAIQLDDVCKIHTTGVQCNCHLTDNIHTIGGPFLLRDGTSSSEKTSKARRHCQSSQADLLIQMMCGQSNGNNCEGVNIHGTSTKCIVGGNMPTTVINEATRLLQTEISINPRICEATLSDINIIADCARLCSEQTRHVPLCSEDADVRKTFSDVQTSCGTEKLLVSSCDNIFKTCDSGTADMDLRIRLGDTNNNEDIGKLEPCLTNFSGNIRRANQNMNTDKVKYTDRLTYNRDGCSKHAQSSCKTCNCSSDQNKNCFGNNITNTGSPRVKNDKEIRIKQKNLTLRSPKRQVTHATISPDRIQRQRSPSHNFLEKDLRQDMLRERRRRSSAPSHIYQKNSLRQDCQQENTTNKQGECCRPRSPINNNTEKSPREKSPRQHFSREKSPRPHCSREKSPIQNSPRKISPINYSPREKSRRDISPRDITPRERSPERVSPRERIRLREKASQCGSPRQRSPERKPNTYPKNVTLKDKKPFRRANTDTGVVCSIRNSQAISKDNLQKNTSKCVGCNTESTNEPLQSSKETGAVKNVENKNPVVTSCVCSTAPNKKLDPIKRTVTSTDHPESPSNSTCVGCGTKSKNNTTLNTESKATCEIDETAQSGIKTYTGQCSNRKDDHDKSTNSKCVNCGFESKNKSQPTGGICCAESKNGPDQRNGTNQMSPCDINKVENSVEPTTSKCIACGTNINNERGETCEKTVTKSSEEFKSVRPSSTTSCVGCDPIVEEPQIIPSNVPSCNIFSTIGSGGSCNDSKDPIIDMIQDITRRYSKSEIGKLKKHKCFKEIITVLNYLLETDDSTDQEPKCRTKKSLKSMSQEVLNKIKCSCDKSVQLSSSCRKSCKSATESSDLPISTDLPTTSSDSAACKVLHKIKKECERFHQKRCKVGRKCEISSSTSVNCEGCQKIHYCSCKNHKCKRSKAYIDKIQKKCIAYNLILKNSESFNEEPNEAKTCRPLKNVVIKVPKKFKTSNDDCQKCSPKRERNRSRSCPNESEISSTEEILMTRTVREYLEKNRPDFVDKCSKRQHCLKFINAGRRSGVSPRLRMVVVHQPKCTADMCPMQYCKDIPMCSNRSANCNVRVHSELNSCVQNMGCSTLSTQNRGTSVDMCYNPSPCDSYEQSPFKWGDSCNPYVSPCVTCVQNEAMNVVQTYGNNCRASDRAHRRDLVSMQVERQPDLTNLSSDELKNLAQQIGLDLRRKKTAPKFISEREMKKHTEQIYKTLPEVVQKKEETKKENNKKTNLLMANIFKKNLQKKTLRGSVNISNYSPVIKI